MECKFGQKLVSYFRHDSCCPEYTCGKITIMLLSGGGGGGSSIYSDGTFSAECDPDQCVLDVPVCREDQTLIATRTEGSCCVAHICSKSLCHFYGPNPA